MIEAVIENRLPTSSFRIHASNRLETLVDRLAIEIAENPGDPLAAERIVVPHPVLGRWLRLALASRLGIAAHLRTELPAEFAWSTMRDVVPELGNDQRFSPPRLRWRIFETLAHWREDDALRAYLADEDPRKRFDLATELARVYDRCLLYRPAWIRAWQAGEAPHWQGRLWRQLVAGDDEQHWLAAIDTYRQRLAGRPTPAQDESDAQLELALEPTARGRASFFALVALSPSYLDWLRSAATQMDVHLYLLSPCREFWADIRAPRGATPASAAEHPILGNELLAAWGAPARDMQALLADDLGSGAPEEIYVDPADDTRLATVQQEMLNLLTASEGSASAELAADDSIQIHVCHSATREAEVLHDRLLGVFDEHANVEPADVLILTPNLDEYAPAIEAVFSAAGAIPFNIARRRQRDSAAVQAFLDLLALPDSRYDTEAVLAPLRAASVRAQFALDEADIAAIRGWLQRAGIRWGVDNEHLAQLDLPAASHTWRAGLRRLLLGLALPDAAVVFKGEVPLAMHDGDGSGAGDDERLGRLVRYCELTFGLRELCDDVQTANEWALTLHQNILQPFFADHPAWPELGREREAVEMLVNEFAAECGEAGSTAAIPFGVLRDALAVRATEVTRAVARLADGVTVAQLAAGQVFPAAVVCAIGMNDGAFPRHAPPPTFDLVSADERRIGDRDIRDEDRFAFLEALLAARRCFIVTYTGRDLREDSAIPPALVVTELQQYLAARFATDAGATQDTRHPLQPFSPRYFGAGDDDQADPAGEHKRNDLYSYSAPMARVAAALGQSTRETMPRFTGELPPDEAADDAEIALDDLVRFAAAPVRYFVERRLGMTLHMDGDETADEETFEIGSLDEWALRNDLFALGEASLPPADAATILRAKSRLSGGNAGQVQYADHAEAVALLAEALQPCSGHRTAPPLEVDVQIDEWRLFGTVPWFLADRDELLFWRVGNLRERDRIEAWLRLLAVCCQTQRPATALLFGLGDKVQQMRLPATPEVAAQALPHWFAARRQGRCRPLPFFPATSWAWIAGGDDGHTQAEDAWQGANWSEGHDAYNHLVFPQPPFGQAFEQLAQRLLGPLRSATS